MRPSRRIAAGLALGLLCAPLAACGNSDEVSQHDLSPAAVMRQAAAQSGTSDFRFVMEATQGESGVLRGTGEYRGGETPALHQVMEAPDGLGTSEVLIIGTRAWMKFGGAGGGLAGLFPVGKWFESQADDEFGVSAEDLDFRSFLQSLFAAAEVREVGEEEIDGVSTRHYVGTVTAAAVKASPDIDAEVKKALAEELAAAEGDKAEVEAWVDREFQVRKFAQTGTDVDGEYRMTMTLSNFGEPVDIAEPPKSEVLDEKGFEKEMNKQAREAERKALAKYGGEAELKKACRKLQREFESSFDGGMSDSPTDQNLLVACSRAMTGPGGSF